MNMASNIDIKSGKVTTDFSQPMVLVNDTPLGHMFDDWSEDSAWDALAKHQKYLQVQRSS